MGHLARWLAQFATAPLVCALACFATARSGRALVSLTTLGCAVCWVAVIAAQYARAVRNAQAPRAFDYYESQFQAIRAAQKNRARKVLHIGLFAPIMYMRT